MAADRAKALLTWPCPTHLLAPLDALDVDIEPLAEGAGTSAGMQAAIAGKIALLCHPWVPVDAAVIDAGRASLRVVSTVAVGYDNIDVAACRRYGIAVGHTPGVVVEATADLTYGLILAVMRGIISGDRFVRTGRWLSGQAPLGHDLQAKTLGIVGMGAIGTAVARRASASGMTIVYTNRRPAAATPVPAQFLALTDLLARADCVVILAPLTAATHGMMNAEAFAQMKRGAYFINAARGPLVDSGALYEALVSGQLGGAAVDVVDPEPLPSEHPLLALPNFFITPHIGTATYETREAMVRLMVANAVAGVRGEPLPAAVP
jgi:glyoxylate reductase